jgi:hypothetical protein
MIKTMIVAGALLVGLVMTGPLDAARAADPDVDIGIELGGTYDSAPYYLPVRRGISCREGLRIVVSAGFRRVNPIDCHGSEYSYGAIRRDSLYRITLKSSNGRIKDVDRIRRWGGGYGGGYGDDDYDDGYYGGGYGGGGYGGGGYGGGGYDDYDDEY